MSTSRKNNSASENTKGSGSSRPDNGLTGVKRALEEDFVTKGSTSSRSDGVSSTSVVSRVLEKDFAEGPEDWTPLVRLVFVTRNSGVFRKACKTNNGQEKDVFTITGNFADDKVMVVQVWGRDAERFSRFFSNAAAAAADGEVVWIMPRAKPSGWSFRLASAGVYLRNEHGAEFVFSLTFVQGGSGNSSVLTKDIFPQLYAWTSDPYVLYKNTLLEKALPHYCAWGSSVAEEEDDTPVTCTFQQASPKKTARVENTSVVYGGKNSGAQASDVSFNED